MKSTLRFTNLDFYAILSHSFNTSLEWVEIYSEMGVANGDPGCSVGLYMTLEVQFTVDSVYFIGNQLSFQNQNV